MSTPLRGRSDELGELGRLVGGALDGVGGVVLLEGPPGIGKTALLAAAAELAAAKGLTVARGRADELDQISPWLVLVRALTSAAPPILDRSALDATGGRLDQRGAVGEIFRDALERAAACAPIMVILDDLQWADQATIAALGWLPEQVFSYPIVWMLARRPLPSVSALDALVTRLDATGARHWPLAPLDDAAAMALAADVAGAPLAVESTDLQAVTGGNPLFIVELMRDHPSDKAPDGVPDVRSGRTWLNPTVVGRSLHGVVEAHVRSLSGGTLELLKVASVLGHEFTFGEISDLVGRPSAQLLPAIEEAIAGGILVGTSGGVAFRHDVFRQVLYSTIPDSLVVRLHAEAAAALRRNGAPATRLANQLLIGAQTGDPEAVGSLYQAVAELVGTSPWAAADVALRLVDLVAPETEEQAAAVTMAVQVLGWAGRGDEARVLGETFLESLPVSPVVEAEILAGIRRGWVSHQIRPYPRPIPERVLDDPQVPAGLRATLLAFEQIWRMWRGDRAQADAALDAAAALLAGAGSDLDGAAIRGLWVTSALARGRFVLALERARQDLHLIGSANQAAHIAVTEAMAATCLGGLGRVQEGLEAAEKALHAAEKSGFSFMSTSSRCWRGALLLAAGRLDDAQADATTTSQAALDAGFLDHATIALSTLIEASARRGDLATAGIALQRLPHEPESGSTNLEGFWAQVVMADAHARGAMAWPALDSIVAALADGNFSIANLQPGRLPQLVEVAMKLGKRDAANVIATAATELEQNNDGISILTEVALQAQGLLKRDVALVRHAYEVSQTSETPLLHAIVANHLGGLEAEHGNSSEAIAALEDAFASFTAMGAQADAARVRADLRKLGVRKRWPAVARPDRGWDALTPAELSVVRVVGTGVTSRAAAEHLCLSPDTIHTHLRHAFTKLDIRSRAELARLVATHQG